MNEFRPLLVFADDWGRHPSSAQHLIRHRPAEIRVEWINTIGTRPPRLDLSTMRRALGKLKSWAKPTARPNAIPIEPHSPTVHSPRMWPSFGSHWSRRLNQKLLTQALLPIVKSLSQPPIVITTLPLTADLIGTLPVHRWIYYCVDDFSCWPGYDGATMAQMELDLAPGCDVAIAVSETLQAHLRSLGHDAHLLTHGVDLAFWQSSPTALPNEIANLPRPLVLFWGVVDRRMDTEFVKALSAKLIRGTLLFIGPLEDPDPAWTSLPNVVLLGPRPYKTLPSFANAADVLMMPYTDAPVTRAMQPLKLKEYLATGKPAVVRELPAVASWSDALDTASDAEEFAAKVLQRVEASLSESQKKARSRLSEESWPAKANQLLYWATGATTRKK